MNTEEANLSSSPTAAADVARAVCPISGHTAAEELANSVTHGLGLLLALIGAVALVVQAGLRGDGWHVLACSIYGLCMVTLYASSTFYHVAPTGPLKKTLQWADRTAIYLMIAGSYTPFALVTLRESWGPSYMGIEWGLAAIGITLRTLWRDRFDWLGNLLYLAMGWLIVVGPAPLRGALPDVALAWIFIGGLAYTLGMVFFLWERLAFNHTIWHLFVIKGSACHFFVILLYVLPD